MSDFYESWQRQEELAAEARRWLGTPFRKRAAVRGAGVDCAQLALALWRATGFDPGIAVPAHYSLDDGAHSSTSQVIALAEDCLLLQAVWRRPHDGPLVVPWPGDLLVFAVDRQSAHHVGVCVRREQGEFVHVWRETGVVYGELEDVTFRTVVVAIYRPLASPRGDA